MRAHFSRLLSVALATLVTSLPARANADDAPPSSTDEPALNAPTRELAWSVDVGLRASFIRGSGFDPYATTDSFRQFSIGATRMVVRVGRLSFAPGLRWDVGGSSATARGADASLLVHRIAIPLEGRIDATSFLYAFVRFAPGVAFERVRVVDASAPKPLESRQALFSADASLGGVLSIPMGRSRDGAALRVGLAPELGYGIVSKANIDLTQADDASAPRRTGATTLPELALSGMFVRVSAVALF
jgi:hypothetical protein